ncbi:MAG: hypothetical protein IJJ82_07885 [Clostridia bacterium]|nr:hypothetical protein [Clostridia bacterium]
MGVAITTRQAYSEVDEFLSLLSENLRNEIPRKLRDFFKEEKDNSYVKNIDKNIPIKEQNLKEETLAIIAMLNLQYWCKDEEEKNRLQRIYNENEKKYQEQLKEQYNPDNLFKNRTSDAIQETETLNENVAMVEYKENIIKRFINKIKSILKNN